jgi:TonB-linked SusC/RagA family outer membrane protein
MNRILRLAMVLAALMLCLEASAQDDTRSRGRIRRQPPPATAQPATPTQPAQQPQELTLRGKVVEDFEGTKEPMLGATVAVVDPATGTPLQGTYTRDDGSFQLSFSWKPGLVLKVSYVGYRAFSQVIDPNQTTYDITLQSDDIGVEAVVVTALNVTQKKADLGYSVQRIEGANLVRSGEQNLVQALAGKAAGVQVISSAGVPGASSAVIIRGFSSMLGSNQPLFIVDGVPIDNSTRSVGTLGEGENNRLQSVAQSNRMIDLNPDDIEDINILKGPAAAALYGTRAGAGTVVITTKKGRRGTGNEVNWRSSIEFSQVNRLPKLQDEFAQGNGGQYIPSSPSSWGPRIDGGVDNEGRPLRRFDNLKSFFQTGVNFSNTVSYTTTTDKTAIRFSVGRADQNGVVPNTEFFRNSFRLSVDTDATSWLQLVLTGNYVNSGGKRAQQGSNTSGVMLGLLRTTPTFDNSAGYENPDGSQRSYSPRYDNPFWTVNKNGYEDRLDRFMSSTSAIARPLTWLEITLRTGLDLYSERTDNYFAKGSRAFDGALINDRYTQREIYNDLFATAKYRFNEDFRVSLTVGNNLNERYSINNVVQGTGLQLPNFYNISNASDIKSEQVISTIRMISFFSFAKLHYKDLITLGITGRHETSSTFGPENRGFFYPSLDASFVFTELEPLKNESTRKILSFGKVRAAYSMVGIEPTLYSTRTYFFSPLVGDPYLQPPAQFPYLGVAGYTFDAVLGSRELKPEQVLGIEFGTDLRFLDNRIGIDVTYFYQRTTDAIFRVPVAPSTGFQAFIDNSGEMVNRGWEVVLLGVPVRTKTRWGQLEWTLDVNWTRYRNQLKSLAPGVDALILGGFQGSDIRAVPGKPYGQIYGTRWLRNEAGQLIIGEDGYPQIDPTDGVIGNTQPDYLLGVGSDLRLGKFSFYMLWDVRQGGQLWNGTRGALNVFGMSDETRNRGQLKVFEGVLADGTPNTIAVPLDEDWYSGLGGGFFGPTEQFIEDASWVRLRELTLSYSFEKLNLFNFVNRIDLALTGRNVLLFTDYKGIDPETSLAGAGSNAFGIDYFNMPNTRSLLFSVNFTFR